MTDDTAGAAGIAQRLSAASLVNFAVALLAKLGAEDRQARVFAEALIWSDRIGRPTHGFWRLPAYVDRFSKGLIKCPCNPEFHIGGPSISTLDGDSGFGHYVGDTGMRKAIDLARETGVGLVAVRNSNHFGSAAYYVNLAAREGMLGIATSNSIAKLAPIGGAAAVFGTNPLAIAAPRGSHEPIILDMATSSIAGAKVIRAAEQGERLPEGVLVDAKGQSITDSSQAAQGVMLPFGGAKGSGLAFFVEVLSAVIGGAALSQDVRSMFNNFSGSGENGHCFIAVDLVRLTPLDQYFVRMEHLIDSVKASAPEGAVEPRLPGEIRWTNLHRSDAEGIELDPSLLEKLAALAQRHDVAFPT